MNSRTLAVADTNGLRGLVESRAFHLFVTTVIVVNAITLGLETSPAMISRFGPILHFVDTAALWIFTIELLLKLRV